MVKKRWIDWIVIAFLCICAMVILLPLVMLAAKSCQDSFSGYADFFIWKPMYLNALCRSMVIAFTVSCLCTIFAIFAGYVFAKVSFRGKNIVFFIIVMLMIMPFQVTLLPHYILSKDIGIYDTLLALICPYVFMPFAFFFMTQNIKSVSNEIIEAGRLETNSTFCIIMKLVAPNVKPGILCTFLLVFTESWNQVSEPQVLMETASKMPLASILHAFETVDPVMYVAGVFFIGTPLLLFLLCSDSLETEIIFGNLKG